MVYGHEGDLCPDLMIEIIEHSTIKILYVVDYDLFWNSIMIDDVLPEEFLDGHGGYVGDGIRLDPLGEVLYCHYGDYVCPQYRCPTTAGVMMG
jgi:hypothetical protein